MAKSYQAPAMGHVVKEYNLGNTKIVICDDCFRGVSHEEGQRILNKGLTRACADLSRAYYDGRLTDDVIERLGYPAREVRT